MLHRRCHCRIASIILAFIAPLLIHMPTAVASDPVSAEEVQQQISKIENDTSLVEQTRNELLAQLKEALNDLEREANFNLKAANIQNAIDNAPQQAAEFRRRLEQARGNPPDTSRLADPKLPPQELRAQLTLLEAERAALDERLGELLEKIEQSPARRVEMQERLAELRARTESPAPPLATSDDSAAQVIAQLAARAEVQAQLAEQRSLEVEILSDSALSEVETAERAWINQALEILERKSRALNQALEISRATATEEQLAATAALQEKIQTQAPGLREIARENRRLAGQLRASARKQDLAKEDGEEIRNDLEAIKQDSHLMQRRLEVAGRKDVLGRVLITRLDSLPNTETIRRSIDRRNEQIALTSLEQIDVEEEFRSLSQNGEYLRSLFPDFDRLDSSSQELLASLATQREELLRDNHRALGDLLRTLLDTNQDAREVIAVTESFRHLLVGNLLWVRNYDFLDIAELYQQLSALLSPVDWLALPRQMLSGMLADQIPVLLLVVLFATVLLRWRLRKPYVHLMGRPSTLSGESLVNILLGFGYSVVLVLPWPLLLYISAYFLQVSDLGTEFSDAFSAALQYLAPLLLLLLLTRMTANRLGVGRRFLKWNVRMLDAVRTELNWAGPLLLLAIGLNRLAVGLDVVSHGGPLGVFTATAIAGALIVFSLRLLRRDSFQAVKSLRIALRIVAAIAGVVIIMQLMGLMFAAEMYLLALLRSIVLVLLIKVVSDILERWLLILRAGLKKKAMDGQRAQEQHEDAPTQDTAEDQVDVLSLSEAHRKLLTLVRLVTTAAVLWFIWSPSLPAFNLLDSFTLWQVSDPNNPTTAVRAITLFDLALGVVILVITGLITMHLPSLGEVFMREWSNMSAGARYASSILMQYLVIAIGGSMFLSIVGWEWSKVQWLVAALGVGIGFGLQEIVANFISGIIILFERPIRVGDIISAGGAEGTVKKINPRATIIETFDRKEHLIPNKELITGQVVNWSLTEQAVRVIIPVGIAYGSDVRRALSLLLEAAREVDRVLSEPEPRATFEDFGDNALVLWLRCYVAEDRPGVWTELRNCINDKFSEAGIVIAYPQRDIHLDTAEPLQIELLRPAPPDAS